LRWFHNGSFGETHLIPFIEAHPDSTPNPVGARVLFYIERSYKLAKFFTQGRSYMDLGAKTTRQQERYWLLLIILLLWPTRGQPAEIQNPPPQLSLQLAEPKVGNILTLDEAVQTALDNNPSIKAARERIGAQQAVLGQQMGAYYPTITSTERYQTGTQSGGTGVSADGSDFFTGGAAVNMTLYNFGKREGSVQAARETLNATGFNYRTTVDSVILGVKQSYYTYLQARAIVQVRQETVNNRDLLVRQAQAFFEVGTRARIDVVRAEANLYTAQADLISAQNAVAVAWVVLKNAVGVRDFPLRPLVEDTTMTVIPYALDQAREIAYASRPELKSFDAQLRAQDQTIATARRGHLPDIIFDSSYARRHVSNETGKDLSGRTITLPTFPLRPSWQVQLSLVIPIFDGFRTTNRVEETVRTYYSIQAQEEQQRQQVALDVEQSYLKLLELQERIKANEAAARAAKENLDLANGRYEVGVGSIIEVTDAQNTYTDAQTTYVRALYDYKIADAQFARAVGQ
jgi:outer membrane protein